ncbi:MAG: hypothetical protein HN380_29545 [Victivallales bacterium]|nr:hypothetical protein [Victivallales bacterium]
MLLRRQVGKGRVYVQAADVVGYPLVALLERVFQDMDATPNWHLLAEIRLVGGSEAAPNVLVSRRSYSDRHALLLQNRDGYAKDLQLRLPGIGGGWQVSSGLTQRAETVDADGSVRLALGAGDPAVLIWRR